MIARREERVLIQGITGREGTFWTERMRAFGTTVIGGIDPARAGEIHLDRPVWRSAGEAYQDLLAIDDRIDVSVLFVPPMEVKAAAMEAIDAGVRRVVIPTKGVPIQDAMYLFAAAEDARVSVLGPGSAGSVTPGEAFIGCIPACDQRVFRSGAIGVLSRSASLGALVCHGLVRAGLGVSAFIDIGGDPIVGTTLCDGLRLLDQDERTDGIALIGKVDGTMEEETADAAAGMKTPIAAFVAGKALRPNGHQSGFLLDDRGGYAAKKAALESAGIAVLPTPAAIARKLSEAHNRS